MSVGRLIHDARAAGLRVHVEGDRLIVRGPREAGALAHALLNDKPAVIAHLTRRQPCAAGITPCGTTPTRLYPCGWRCEEHRPRPRRAA